MAAVFAAQLEPFEEDLSPPIIDSNPYEQSLSGSTSPTRNGGTPTLPSANTANSLQTQLSGDPESPPTVWKRRPSSSTQRSPRPPSVHSTRPASVHSVRSTRSPDNPAAPPSRRHPHLTMTATRAALPGQMFAHESPSGSLIDLTDLALPQPPFRRRTGNSSNRSSIHSSQDLNALSSEELWHLDGFPLENLEDPDRSNPHRSAGETPLRTAERLNRQLEGFEYKLGLPGEVIWPPAPPPEEVFLPPTRTRSSASISSMTKAGRRVSRKTSRQQSLDNTSPNPAKAIQAAKSVSASPVNVGPGGLMSSAHSSETSLSSQVLSPNKSFSSRPPSTYYSRDFLSSLAPREGGYAIAAQMGNGLGAVGTMAIEERRKSGVFDDGLRSRSAQRPPVAKSAGMGRWSLDGGENYGRPYVTSSAATTSSNLSAPPINSPAPSPPEDVNRKSYLPEGAGPPAAAMVGGAPISPSPSTPSRGNSSPLSQQTGRQPPAPAVPVSPTSPVSSAAATAAPAAAVVSPKKSKKELAKEAKAAEKAEQQRIARGRAEAARAEALKKQRERESAIKAKEEAKRKDKEDKARLKAEKKASKLKSPSSHSLPFRKDKSTAPALTTVPPVPTTASRGPTTVPSAPTTMPSAPITVPSAPTTVSPVPTTVPSAPTTVSPVPTAAPRVIPLSANVSQVATPAPSTNEDGPASVPFPRTASMPMATSPPAATPPRPVHTSMPMPNGNAAKAAPPVEPKRKTGLLGTIKKHFSSKNGEAGRPPATVPGPLPRVAKDTGSTRLNGSSGTKTPSTQATESNDAAASQVPRSVPEFPSGVPEAAPVLAPVERVTSDSPSSLQRAAENAGRDEATMSQPSNRPTTPSKTEAELAEQLPSTPSLALHRSVSQQQPCSVLTTGSPIARAVSQDRTSPSPSRRSVRGPRAMPGRPNSLAGSIPSDMNHSSIPSDMNHSSIPSDANHSSIPSDANHSSLVGSGPSDSAHDTGFPFQPASLSHTLDLNTPTTSGESSRGGGESVITPLTTDEEGGAEVSSTSADRYRSEQPEREDSKSSSETVTNANAHANVAVLELEMPLIPAR